MISNETEERIAEHPDDPREHFDTELDEIKKEIASIKIALIRAGIQI